jgi:ATP-dependent Clp protease ATP-binding subunit ClpC
MNNIDNIIEKDGALGRRFQKELLKTTYWETITTLNITGNKFEDHHNVICSDNTMREACVKLTDRYMSERWPDKAIDALDEAGSRSPSLILKF